MQVFFISLCAVAVLLVTAVPGFVLKKLGLLPGECILGFSRILVYVSQPCLIIYTFMSTPFSRERLASLGWFALACLAIHAVMLGGAFLVLNKKSREGIIYRILTVATTFGNCAFFGIPVIEALFPDTSSDLIIYTTVYAVVMNVLGWTVGSAIISRDTRYISPKKIFFNPILVGLAIGMLLFVTGVDLTFTLPGGWDFVILRDTVTIVARMATPISMIVMGMRLATVRLRDMLSDVRIYLTILVKQLVMPLVALLLVKLFPLAPDVRAAFYIICACPAASVVLSYSELCGTGQKEAASTVLLSTALNILTLPLMMLLLPLV